MAAYVLAQVQINDRAGFREYTNAFAPTLSPFGGKVLTADDESQTVEGTWPDGRIVILEFDTTETAHAWYRSDAYQRISSIRRANSDASMVVIAGI